MEGHWVVVGTRGMLILELVVVSDRSSQITITRNIIINAKRVEIGDL